ncbi:F-box/LRR-repeat protein, partial [Striga asiatica]
MWWRRSCRLAVAAPSRSAASGGADANEQPCGPSEVVARRRPVRIYGDGLSNSMFASAQFKLCRFEIFDQTSTFRYRQSQYRYQGSNLRYENLRVAKRLPFYRYSFDADYLSVINMFSHQLLICSLLRCPNLLVLSIKSSPHITYAIMTKLASGFPKLRELDINYSYEISSKLIALKGSHCTDLIMLKHKLLNWLDPSEHMGIVSIEPHLISEGCQNLEYIDLFGCANLASWDITNAITNFKNLKDIREPTFTSRDQFFMPRDMVTGDCTMRGSRQTCIKIVLRGGGQQPLPEIPPRHNPSTDDDRHCLNNR